MPASALGARQNAATVTLKCAKYKESHFKARCKEEKKKAGQPLRYSEGSVSGSADRARKQHRPGPLGVSCVGQVGSGPLRLLPNALLSFFSSSSFFKGQMEKKLVVELSGG